MPALYFPSRGMQTVQVPEPATEAQPQWLQAVQWEREMYSSGPVPSAVIQILLNSNLGNRGQCKVFGRSSWGGHPPFGSPLHSRQTVNTSTVAEVRERKERRAAAKSGK